VWISNGREKQTTRGDEVKEKEEKHKKNLPGARALAHLKQGNTGG